ncbi:MAG: hypothetical protein RMJ59_03740 [Candidatus Nitrosocaldus sp.]|nr:hypothetical protein [Candidatus Nitrosocaldus sp.]MDW8275478.1 hypothetical protein [Candidatus Nitrosocaldus sp.]
MNRIGVTYVVIAIASALLALYILRSIEVDSKDREIAELNDRMKRLNPELVEQIRMTNRLVDERIMSNMLGGSESRHYMLDGSYIAIDNQNYDGVYPIGIFTDGEGNVIVVSATGRIVKMDSNGREMLTIGIGADVDTFHPLSFDEYSDVTAVDGSGNIYLHDHNAYMVDWEYVSLLSIFNRNGDLIEVWTTQVYEKSCDEDYYYVEDSFTIVREIAAYSNGDIAIAGDDVIKRFSRDGKFIAMYVDPCYSEISSVIDIAMDEDDNLYVLEAESYNVYKLDEEGRITATWSMYEYYIQNNYPMEIRVHNGHVYVLDVEGTIRIFTDSGSLVDRIDVDGGIDFAVSNDAIYIMDDSFGETRAIKKYSKNGLEVWKVYRQILDYSKVHDITVSRDNIFIALYDRGEIKIYKYDKHSGVKVGEWVVVPKEEYIEWETARIAYGDGKVIVALYNDRTVKVYDEHGSKLTEYTLDSTLGSHAIDVDIYSDGYVYAALNDGLAVMKDGTVVKRIWITGKCTMYGYVIPHYKPDYGMYGPLPGGPFEIEWEEPVPAGTNCSDPDGDDGPLEVGDGQFFGVGHIAVDADGHIHVLDEANRRIQVFNRDLMFIDKLDFMNLPNPNRQIDAVVDMDVDDNGYIYIATTKSIMVIDNDSGRLVASWGAYATQQIRVHAHHTHSH